MNKFKWFLGLVLFAVLAWYLFLKKEHYQITFTTPQPPGVVYHHLLDWPSYGKEDSLNIVLNEKQRYGQVDHTVGIHDSLFNYHWNIERINDSTTKVTAKITDLQNRWIQKVQAPFGQNNFVRRSIQNVQLVGNEFVTMKKSFRVASISDTLVPATYCAYVKVSTPINEKASSMLQNISTAMTYIKENDIPLNGDPFLEVTHWDREQNKIDFNFCFPIKKTDSMPEHATLLFKETAPVKSLKAVFHGNYRISENAWYYLMDYAEQNDLDIELLPTEIYLNDPHAGGNPLEWEAHILVPLKEKK